MHHIILDMDGVLSDSWDDTMDGLQYTDLQGNTREERLRNHEMYCRRRPQHARQSGLTDKKHAWISGGLSVLVNHLNTVKPPLFDSFVVELAKVDAVMAVASASGISYVNMQAKRTKLPFTHILAWEDSPSKEDKIERICNDWRIPVSEVIYVTDTLADVYELETMMPREHIIGCAWGYCGYAVLREELPKEQVLKKPEDIHDVISKMKIQKSNNK